MQYLEVKIKISVSVRVVAIAAAMLGVATAAVAGNLESIAMDTLEGNTRVSVAVSGDVRYHGFIMRNPNRLVLEFVGSTSSLPAELTSEELAGLVEHVQVIDEQHGGSHRTRVVLTLGGRVSYSISRDESEVVVVLQRTSPKANELGYDEDHLASACPGHRSGRESVT